MTNPLTGILPAAARRYLYAAYALAGVVLGCLQIADVQTGKTAEVLAYVGVALGITAASNVTHSEGRHVRAESDSA